MHYHAVYDHIRRQAPKFLAHLQKTQRQRGAEIAKLRPHSGRATLITELMGEGLTTALSMKYARHAPSSYKVHLKYGRLTLQDVRQACDATRGSSSQKTKVPMGGHVQQRCDAMPEGDPERNHTQGCPHIMPKPGWCCSHCSLPPNCMFWQQEYTQVGSGLQFMRKF